MAHLEIWAKNSSKAPILAFSPTVSLQQTLVFAFELTEGNSRPTVQPREIYLNIKSTTAHCHTRCGMFNHNPCNALSSKPRKLACGSTS